MKSIRELLRRTNKVEKQTGIKKYGDLVTTQELIRQVGMDLDKVTSVAPIMTTFTIDTPRNSFTIICNSREQKKSETIPEKPKKGRR